MSFRSEIIGTKYIIEFEDDNLNGDSFIYEFTKENVKFSLETDSTLCYFGQANWKVYDLDSKLILVDGQENNEEQFSECFKSKPYYYQIRGYFPSAFDYSGVFETTKNENGKLLINRNGNLSKGYENQLLIQNKERLQNVAKSNINNSGCRGRDERFIINKMGQLNRDVIGIQETGNRVYLVTYVDWSTGSGSGGNILLDYSNQPPCN